MITDKSLKTLKEYIPIVARVHGQHHPEFYEVKEIFDKISTKINLDNISLNLHDEFEKLRTLTNNYQVPNDVCETYEIVYVILSELDQAYTKALFKE